jgi:hypothetical protein
MVGDCPDTNLVAALIDGTVDGALRMRLETHFDSCDACTRLVAELARLAPPSFVDEHVAADDTQSPELEPGGTIGRFTLRRFNDALARLATARVISTKAPGPGHPGVADLRVSIGETLDVKHELREALAELARAVAAFEAAVGADAKDTAWLRVSSACLQLQLHENVDQALPVIDRALSTLERANDPEHLAHARFALGRALARRDRPRAVDLVRGAREYFASRRVDPATSETLSAIDRWLTAHARSCPCL